MDQTVDVVVVGGGIAGSAVAYALAQADLGVVVLERQTSYRDKVRGEYLHPWGVAEAQRLGLEAILLAGGGCWMTEMMGYDELIPASAVNPFQLKNLGDIPNAMDLGHPQTCAALSGAAVAAGAEVRRGVGDVFVTPGPAPSVRYELDDVEHELRCRLVVAADGRASSVRRQLDLPLHKTEARTWGAGMLASGLDFLPTNRTVVGSEGDVHYLMFPRERGLARLYIWHALDQTDRFAGPDRQREFLEAFRLDCLPFGDEVADGEPAGPCAKYPMNDTWIDSVALPGVVFIGDAAGYNDAIIGEGLSISLRDARTVAETMTTGADWTPEAFVPYGEERAERMRRLRICASLHTDFRCTFTPEGRARRGAIFAALGDDPLLGAAMFLGAVAGPEAAPAEAFEQANIDRILALG